MKTAVEWLVEHLTEYGFDLSHHELEIKQAKEMEKDKTKKAYEVGLMRGMDYDEEIYHKNNWNSSEKWYNETFKSE